MLARLRDFKIDGICAEREEEGNLTYWSLVYQVNYGIDRGFEEPEIIHAVIQAITPGSATRTYLEGRRSLTLAKVMRTMKNHFGVGHVSTYFRQMLNATQGLGQTPYQFIVSMLSMRDRVLELAGQDKATAELYTRELVQQEMQRGIHVGLREEERRRDLQVLPW